MISGIRLATVVAWLPAGIACAPALDRCFGTDSPMHTASLAREFEVGGFQYRVESGNVMCVEGGLWLETDRIRARVDAYRRGAADLVRSDGHRERLVEALEREGKEYQIGTTDRGNELVVIFSGSEAELTENQALLESLE